MANGQATMLSVTIPTFTPTLINSVSTLSYSINLSSNVKFQSGSLRFYIPAGSFSSGTACSITAYATVTSCVASTNQVVMTFTVTSSISPILSVQLTKYNNPSSASTISGLETYYYDTSNSLIQQFKSTQLIGLTPNTMTTLPTITPTSQIIGATSSITVQFTNVGTIPSGGQIFMTFPSWTPTVDMVSSPVCQGLSNLPTTLTCSYSSSLKTLTLSGFTSSNIGAGTTFRFSVTNVRNPYNAIPKSGFYIYTADSAGGYIDQSSVFTMTVSNFATLTNYQIYRTGSTQVGAQSVIAAVFFTDLPVDKNCRAHITFPSDMPITSDLTSINGQGFLAGGTISNSASMIADNYIEIDGCSLFTDYTSGNIQIGYADLINVKNKAFIAATGTFSITFYAMIGTVRYNIAQIIDASLYLDDFTPGTVSAFTLTPTISSVQTLSTYAMTLTPSTAIPNSSKITISFPSNIVLSTSSTCTLTSLTVVSQSSCSITSSGGIYTLTITNPFGASNSYLTSQGALKFTLSPGGTNPLSVNPSLTPWTVSTYYTSGTDYQIDTGTFSNLFVPTRTQMSVTVSAISSKVACDTASYTLTITPQKIYPVGSLMRIVFPTEVAGSVSSCTGVISGTSLSFTHTTSNTSPITIQITNAFNSQAFSPGSSITVTCAGLTNPVSTATTGSFAVYVMDSGSFDIEYDNDQATATMLSLSPLTSFNPTLGTSRNGDSTYLQISVTVNCPMASNSVLEFQVPSEVTLPGSLSCSTYQNLASVSCNQGSSNLVSAQVSFSSSPLQKGQTFIFRMSTIKNPQSTKTTSAFASVAVYDNSGNQVNTFSGTYPTLRTTLPGLPSSSFLTQATYAYSGNGQYTITYTNINQLPAGACFQIGYPANFITVASTLSLCQVQTGVTYPFSTCQVDDSNGIIYMRGSSISTTIPAGTIIQVAFSIVTNPASQLSNIPSLTMNSFTDSTYDYQIDQISTGLLVTFACNYPCFTCQSSSQKSVCTSCNPSDPGGYTLLQSSACVSSCSDGYYPLSNVCAKCLTACATCSTGSTCDTCSTSFPILYQNLCINSCSGSTYQNSGTCKACDTTCKTCTSNLNSDCTTCDTTGLYPYLYQGQCLSSCGSNFIVLNNKCVQCTNNCQTCSGTASFCLTCIGGFYLKGANGNTCISSCPTGYVLNTAETTCLQCTGSNCNACSVTDQAVCTTCATNYYNYNGVCYSPCPQGSYTSGTSCFACDNTCKTCNGGLTSNCLSCATATPNMLSGTCYGTCPDGYVANSGVCRACTNNCNTCQVTTSTCKTCDSGYFYYNNKCYDTCPAQTTVSGTSCTLCGSSNCISCDSSNVNQCNKCSTNYFLYNGNCVGQCLSTQYSATINGVAQCVDCNSNCKTCSGSSTTCTGCTTSGAFPYLSGSQCIQQCTPGTVAINNVCQSCTPPCLTCTVSYTQCETCIASNYLLSGTCSTTCPSGYYISNKECLQCTASNCKVCSASSPAICTTCSSGYYLYNGNCIQTCLSNTYISGTNCINCDTKCKTCGTSSTNCLSCDTSGTYPYMHLASCVTTCPAGYVPINNVCTKCTSPCLTCQVSQTQCVNCVSGYYAYQGGCVNKCPAGSTLQGGICTRCNTNCNICLDSDYSKCTSCYNGYYLYQNICYAVCPNGYVIDSTRTTCVPPSSTTSSSSSKPSSSSSSKTNTTNNTTNTTTPDEVVTNSTDKPYLYFPVSTTQAILGGVAAGSYLKDPASLVFSNTLGLWAPLEFIAYGGQLYLAYVQEVAKETQKQFVTGEEDDITTTTNSSHSSNSSNSSNSTNKTNSTTAKRRLAILSSVSNTGWPLVFYGTAGSFGMLIITNIIWAIVHSILMRSDNNFKDHKKRHKCSSQCIYFCSGCCNFKVGRLHHSRFYGLQKFSAEYEKRERVHNILNILTIVNLVLTLLPIFFVDIYGLIMNKWGNQFYIMIIETLFLTVTTIAVTVFEFKHSRLPLPKENDYAKVADMSAMEDELRDRIESEIKKRFGGDSIEEYLRKLREMKGLTLKGLGKSQSMTDLNRDLEEDDRRVHTDPLDEEEKKAYLSRPNPFQKNSGIDYFNNCYAEVGRLIKKVVPESNRRTKVIQTGDRVMDGEEYDRDFDQRLKDLYGKNDSRKDARLYGGTLGEEEDPQSKRKNNKSKMRGRKDKYYEQVDNEDMAFAEDSDGPRKMLGEDDEDEELDLLDKIEEQDEGDEENEEELKRQQELLLLQQKEEEEKQRLLKEEEEAKLKQLEEEARQKLLEEEEQRKKEEEEKFKKAQEELKKAQEEEELKRREEEEKLEREALEKEKQEQEKLQKEEEARKEQERLEQERKLNEQKAEEERLRKEEEERKLQEEKLLQDDNQNLFEVESAKGDGAAINNQDQLEQTIIDDMKDKSSNMSEDERGVYDSDDDNERRLRNMTNPDLRKFNVNDILGDFDRDEKGNLVMLQNQKGGLIDKSGNQVNEKGYLIDEKTGDVLEKENRKKVFDKKDLDERGELPPPFNIERYNFNPHDVRGSFDRDAHGDEIIGTRKNDQGHLVDKLGRLVNEHGFLVDDEGNIVDKRGRLRLHHKQLDADGGMPMLFNYKGKKFDIKDVIGDFDKDRTGNIIIRRDKDNQMVDKKGRRVNNKGYLVDKDGNVINLDGKVVFEATALSKDNEIPKFFPFLKFNVEDIKGDYEMDPLGNPMLSKNPKGELLDNKGRKVNSKGYLIDDSGNIKNKRGYKVFGRTLMEDDGEIPKVFRTGLFRKDTVDSFSQLMNEIEDLEKLHELGENGNNPHQNNKEDENDRINRIIKQIDEEDNDDDIMKEIEELGNMRKDGDDASEGGNTSVDIRMEDTPSNYNNENQRFLEQEEMRNRVKQQIAKQRIPRQRLDDDEDAESEYMELPGKRLKKKKRKPKKKKAKEPTIDERDLKMAQAYGGLSQAQVDRLLQEKKRKEAIGGSQLTSLNNKPPLQKNASNARLGSVQSRRFAGGNDGNGTRYNSTTNNLEEAKSELGQRFEQVPKDLNISTTNLQPRGRLGYTEQVHPESNRNALREAGKSTAKRTGGGYIMDIKKNNLFGTTNNSFRNGGNNEVTNSQKSFLPRQLNQQNQQDVHPRDRRLSNIANSVSGFYREPTISEHSKLRSTHESNFATNMNQGNNRLLDQSATSNINNNATQYKRNPNLSQDEQRLIQNKMGGPDGFDPELERMYGVAKGFGDMSMLSDWEKVSNQSGESRYTQMTGVLGAGGQGGPNNQKKIRGLESIYLQRLEGAEKGRATQQLRKKKQGGMGNATDKQFRVMNKKFADDGNYDMDDPRDELDSVLSENYKMMERQFKQEFVKGPGQNNSNSKQKQGYIDDSQRPNIFHGNFYQYKEKKEREKQKSHLDFEKQ